MSEESSQGKEIRLRQTYRSVFSSDEGQLLLADLSHFCGYGALCFREAHPDTTAYLLGTRRVYLHILDKLDLEKLQKLQEESASGEPQVEEDDYA